MEACRPPRITSRRNLGFWSAGPGRGETAVTETEQEPIDGRTARALRTRTAIVDACIELVHEGDLRPSALRVADRAQVSVRSVFQHFEDLEGLYSAVAERFVERLSHLVSTVDPHLRLRERITETVLQRSRLLEAITPIRRAAAVHAPFSREITARLRSGHDFLRSEVERLFATELDARPVEDRECLLDALDTVLSWPSWENLRTLNERSQDEARSVLEHALRALLGAPT